MQRYSPDMKLYTEESEFKKIAEGLNLLVSELDEKKGIDYQALNKIIELCDAYLTKVPEEHRKGYLSSWTPAEDKAKVDAIYPNMKKIYELQQEAVRRLFLPKDQSVVKSRWKLIRTLVAPETPGPGKVLEEDYWREYRFQGQVMLSRWLEGIPGNNLESYSEFLKRSEKNTGLNSKNIDYFADEKSLPLDVIYDSSKKMLLLKESKKPVDTSGCKVERERGITIYAVTRDGFRLLGPDQQESLKLMAHHSSMFKGQPVICAGTIAVKNGKITMLSNDSGHYKPQAKDLIRLIHHLKVNKFDLSGTRINYFDGDKMNNFKNVEEFLRSFEVGKGVEVDAKISTTKKL